MGRRDCVCVGENLLCRKALACNMQCWENFVQQKHQMICVSVQGCRQRQLKGVRSAGSMEGNHPDTLTRIYGFCARQRQQHAALLESIP